jgi:YVTN family beta-propeller protein
MSARRAPSWCAGSVLALLALAACGQPGAPPPLPQAVQSAQSGGAVVATIPVGAPPTLLAVAPDSRHVYAASNGSLTVIDTSSNTAVARLSINPNSTGIAVAPNGSLVYVASLFSINLTVLDTSTNTLARPIQLFLQRLRGGFAWMALSPDGGTAYIANRANRRLAIVSLPGGRGHTVMPDVGPSDVALTPDGRTLYVSGCKPICVPGFVQTFDTATRRFTHEIAVGSSPFRVVIAPDGAHAYTADLAGATVSVIDVAAATTTTRVPVPVQPTGLAVSPDNRTLWVASQTGGTLTAIDATTNQVRASLPIQQARDVVATPDGRRVYVSSDNSVAVIDPAALGGAQ